MKVKDKKTGKIEEVIDFTSSSFLVTQHRTTDRGIDCQQWFTQKDFEKRFEPLPSKPENK